MVALKEKCYIDQYDIEINSYLTYEEGYGLIQKIFECIEFNSELPTGTLTIDFEDYLYSISISKSDNKRITKLLHDLGYDTQYVESIYELENY